MNEKKKFKNKRIVSFWLFWLCSQWKPQQVGEIEETKPEEPKCGKRYKWYSNKRR